MLCVLLRRLGVLCGRDRETVFEALEFAHGALKDACFCEDGVDGLAGPRILDMIEVELRKHGRPFTSYIVPDDWPVT